MFLPQWKKSNTGDSTSSHGWGVGIMLIVSQLTPMNSAESTQLPDECRESPKEADTWWQRATLREFPIWWLIDWRKAPVREAETQKIQSFLMSLWRCPRRICTLEEGKNEWYMDAPSQGCTGGPPTQASRFLRILVHLFGSLLWRMGLVAQGMWNLSSSTYIVCIARQILSHEPPGKFPKIQIWPSEETKEVCSWSMDSEGHSSFIHSWHIYGVPLGQVLS